MKKNNKHTHPISWSIYARVVIVTIWLHPYFWDLFAATQETQEFRTPNQICLRQQIIFQVKTQKKMTWKNI